MLHTCATLTTCQSRDLVSRLLCMHTSWVFFTLYHTQLLHNSHLNTEYLIAKIQTNLARNKINTWLNKFNLTNFFIFSFILHSYFYLIWERVRELNIISDSFFFFCRPTMPLPAKRVTLNLKNLWVISLSEDLWLHFQNSGKQYIKSVLEIILAKYI